MCSTRQRLAAVLREQRSAQGLSLRQAAECAQLAPSTLSRWESGSCLPRVPELEALLRALRVSDEHIRRILISLDAPRAVKAARGPDHGGPDLLLAPSGGALLRALRCKARMSITGVAQLMGVNPSTVSRWESGMGHPSAEVLSGLLDILGASPEARECLTASGVAKLRVERPPYDRERFTKELDEIETDTATEHGDRELRLLQLQSMLWWFRREPGASELLLRAFASYAEFLCAAKRYSEAAEQAQAILDSGIDPFDAMGLRVYRSLARGEVYRWPKPRPHVGLYLLQRCLHSGTDQAAQVGVLRDMAEYSHLAGRDAEAESYAERAAGRFSANYPTPLPSSA